MKVMFICTGNICRSAMAEGIMKKIVQDQAIEVEVYSCGTYAETGEYATDYAVETVKEYGVDISKHRATNIRESKIKEMDIILCATTAHKQMVEYWYPTLKEKVYTIKEYARLEGNLDIQDPWGYDKNVYEQCALEIKQCLEIIAENWKRRKT